MAGSLDRAHLLSALWGVSGRARHNYPARGESRSLASLPKATVRDTSADDAGEVCQQTKPKARHQRGRHPMAVALTATRQTAPARSEPVRRVRCAPRGQPIGTGGTGRMWALSER
jgi:hypothetical protein